jgi:hypothetical protein
MTAREKILKNPDLIVREKTNLLPNHVREWRFCFKKRKVQLISSYEDKDGVKREILRKTYSFENKKLPANVRKIIEEKDSSCPRE